MISRYDPIIIGGRGERSNNALKQTRSALGRAAAALAA